VGIVGILSRFCWFFEFFLKTPYQPSPVGPIDLKTTGVSNMSTVGRLKLPRNNLGGMGDAGAACDFSGRVFWGRMDGWGVFSSGDPRELPGPLGRPFLFRSMLSPHFSVP